MIWPRFNTGSALDSGGIDETVRRVPWSTRLHLDFPLLVGLVLLAGFGLLILYSASGGSAEMMQQQAMRLLVAFSLMVAIAQLPPHWLKIITTMLFTAGIIMLILVPLFGVSSKGAQRWLDLGAFRFQPSEMMKLVIPMMVALYLTDKQLPPQPLRLLIASVMIVIPVLLIARQPDLGTSLLIGSSGFFVLFLAGLPWRVITGLGVLAGAAMPILWSLLKDYQKQRVLTFLDPEKDPLGAGYHIIQSKIAIGSGGLFGKGWMEGTQSQLSFLPERHTDFIFAVLAEEFGLIGVILLFALYLFLVWRALSIAIQAQETYTRLLAGALAMTFFIYFFVNVGMVSGILPVVGLPLPLVSYGGTAMVTTLVSFGILMSIHTHRKLLDT
jgi:rod shape determining protein RodA